MTMQDDVFGSAGVPEERKQVYFSKMEVDGYYGIFNPRPTRYFPEDAEHQRIVASGKNPVVCYEVFFAPVTGNGNSFTKVMVKNSEEWKAIFNSLRDLWGMVSSDKEEQKKLDVKVSEKIGQVFRGNDAWVKRELVETDTYKDKTTGEQKVVMGSKIVEVYMVEQDAVNAANEFYGVVAEDGIPGFDNATSGAEPPKDFGDKQTAMAFLPQFVQMAKGGNPTVDRDKLAAFINDNPVLSAHFTMESEEVQDAIADVETDPPF